MVIKIFHGRKSYAQTYPASDVTSTGVTLNGYIGANYSSTTVTFEYGTSTGYGQSIAAVPGAVTDWDNVTVNISGLSAVTEYHFRVKAVNAVGTTYGADQSFITSGGR